MDKEKKVESILKRYQDWKKVTTGKTHYCVICGKRIVKGREAYLHSKVSWILFNLFEDLHKSYIGLYFCSPDCVLKWRQLSWIERDEREEFVAGKILLERWDNGDLKIQRTSDVESILRKCLRERNEV